MNHFPSTLEQYRSQGYVAPVQVMNEAEALGYRQAMEASEQRLGRQLTFSEQLKPHLLFSWARDLVRHPKVLDAVETITGPDILAWSVSLLIKPPGGREHFTWHQDLTYWGLDPADQILTAWISLSASTPESGCMRVLPGSNHSGITEHEDTYAPGNLLTRSQRVKLDINDADAVDVVLHPGQMSLHDVYIIHGSKPNQSQDRRIGFVARYMPTSVKSKAKMRDSAYLARGVDRYGHFDLEPDITEFETPAALAIHDDFLRRRKELQLSL